MFRLTVYSTCITECVPLCHRKAKVAFGYTPTDTDAVMNREEFDGEAKTLTYVSFVYMNYQGVYTCASLIPRLSP